MVLAKKQTMDSFLEKRNMTRAISGEDFLKLETSERLGGSFTIDSGVIGNQEYPEVKVYALPDSITYCSEAGKGIRPNKFSKLDEYSCTSCVMQSIELRSDEISNFTRISDNPVSVAGWLSIFATRINDGMPAESKGDVMRERFFVPYLDSFIGTRPSEENRRKTAQSARVLATFLSRELLPEVFEDERIGLIKQAEWHQSLPVITDHETATENRETGKASYAVAKYVSRHTFDRRSTTNRRSTTKILPVIGYAISATTETNNRQELIKVKDVSHDVAMATKFAAGIIGWKKVITILQPTLAEVIAINAHPIMGRTNKLVANLLDRQQG